MKGIVVKMAQLYIYKVYNIRMLPNKGDDIIILCFIHLLIQYLLIVVLLNTKLIITISALISLYCI